MSQDEELTSLNTQAEEPAVGRSKLVLFTVMIVMVLDLLSFGNFWMGRAITSGEWMHLDQNIRAAVWPEFIAEAQYYAQQDIKPVNAVLDKYLSLDRRSFGNGGPFVDYFFQKAFRVVGFFTLFAGGVLVVLFAGTEAYRVNMEKRQGFGKRSATTYHFFLRFGGVFIVCFFFLYVFMPAKVVIPGLLEAQVHFFLYNPYFWAAAMTLLACCMAYFTVSNITNV